MSSRPRFGAQSETGVLSRIPDREHWWVIDRAKGTIIMFRFAESEKVGGSIFFLLRLLLDLYRDAVCRGIREKHHSDSVW